MKSTLIFVLLTMWASPELKAQTDAPNDSVQLEEVVVRGARVVNRTDGKLIFPSEEMTKSAPSGYNLLKMLPLPNVKVDDINESITAANSLIGAVQVRINDVEASTADIQSLQPREVEKVEFIDRPGVRYGEGVGIVINIITRKVTSGYVIGASGTLVPKADMVKGNAFTKINSGKNELSLNYSGYYRHSNGINTVEQADYLMEDNTYNKVERNTNDIINRNTMHDIQARYSMINADGTAFLTTLSTSIDNNPRDFKKTDVAYSDGRNTTEIIDNSEKTISPLLDLYFKTNIGKNQSLIANATGAYTHIDYAYMFTSDKTSFGYNTLGKKWSLNSEAIYENHMKPFTLSAGLRYAQKYIDNDYSGDAVFVSQIHSSNIYAFSQIQGSLWKISYMVGFGLSREYYRQGETTYDRVWLRPKLNLSMPISKSLRLNYTLTSSPASSKLQNMSGMSIITNEMEYSVGNPDLIMERRDDHTLTLSYQSPRLYTQLMSFYRHNDHPAMQHVRRTEDGHFAKTFLEGRRIDMLMLQSYTNCDIIPQHLNAYLSAEMLNIWNDGQDYSHRLTSFNFNVGLTAWLGNWTIMAAMDNGFHFMENEYESRNIFSDYVSISYKLKNLTASLFCQNLFKSNGKIEEVENHNHLAHKLLVVRNRDTSNAIGIKLTWTLSKGRKFKGIERDTDSLKDKETGVAKSGK
ncbi:MAG: hypothetical protein PUD94_09470 [Prevotellaceae bacterium]|nr:hypothetical protein [Prevotellaceae bacterium]